MNARSIRYVLLMAVLWGCNPATSAEWLNPVDKGQETAGFELKDLQDK